MGADQLQHWQHQLRSYVNIQREWEQRDHPFCGACVRQGHNGNGSRTLFCSISFRSCSIFFFSAASACSCFQTFSLLANVLGETRGNERGGLTVSDVYAVVRLPECTPREQSISASFLSKRWGVGIYRLRYSKLRKFLTVGIQKRVQ